MPQTAIILSLPSNMLVALIHHTIHKRFYFIEKSPSRTKKETILEGQSLVVSKYIKIT